MCGCVCVRPGSEHSTYVCVCVWGETERERDGHDLVIWLQYVKPLRWKPGRGKVWRKTEREGEAARTHGRRGSEKRPVQLAGMSLLPFIDGLMFCKTRGTTVVILWAAMHFFFSECYVCVSVSD